MDISQIFVVLQWVSAILLFIFSVFVISLRKGNRLMRSFLASFLIARALMLIGFTSWNYGIFKMLPDLVLIPGPMLLVYCPLLYLYTRSITHSKNRFRVIDISHFIPAIIALLINLFYYHLHTKAYKLDLLYANKAFLPVLSWSIWMWIQLAVYGSLSVWMMFRNKIGKRSTENLRQHFQWLIYLVIAFLVWKIIFLTYYLSFLFSKENHVYFQVFVEVAFLVYASLIMYKSLQLHEVFPAKPDTPKYRTSPLSVKEKSRHRILIEEFMRKEKPYIDPCFSLKYLSKRISIPEHHLSQIFSEEFRVGFPEFINQCRIEETIRLFNNSDHNSKNILEIMYDSGFSSKSVFNSAFKKYTGMSPKNFRNKSTSRCDDEIQLNPVYSSKS
jgi:AraC-like DNA-binding protein